MFNNSNCRGGGGCFGILGAIFGRSGSAGCSNCGCYDAYYAAQYGLPCCNSSDSNTKIGCGCGNNYNCGCG